MFSQASAASDRIGEIQCDRAGAWVKDFFLGATSVAPLFPAAESYSVASEGGENAVSVRSSIVARVGATTGDERVVAGILAGHVKEGKDPCEVDRKLIAKYGVSVSPSTRARQRERGEASVQYLRYGRRWWLLATHGDHLLKQEEVNNLRDVRDVPIRVGGYSLYIRCGNYLNKQSADVVPRRDGKYRSRVLIARERYAELRAHLLSLAVHRSAENLATEFWQIPFEPYAPIRRQLLELFRLVNKRRQEAGYDKLPVTVLRLKRRIFKVY